jgi:VIT1/CCC1 family predicted Fe2+/Mn2+ transporter
VLSFFASTIAFVFAAYFIRGYLDGIGIPKSMSRGAVVFVAALLIAYGVAFVVDLLAA